MSQQDTRPARIVSAYFQASITLGEATSVHIKNNGVGNVDSIESVKEPAPGLHIKETSINRSLPGAPKVTKECFVPWGNVKSVLYG